MSAISTVLRGRVAAERLMIDTVKVERYGADTEGPGGVLTPAITLVYQGKCRLMVRTRERLGGSWQNVGEAQVIVSRLELQLPIAAPECIEGDRVTMLTSVLDQQFVGKTYAVRDVMVKSYLTARRVTIVEVSS